MIVSSCMVSYNGATPQSRHMGLQGLVSMRVNPASYTRNACCASIPGAMLHDDQEESAIGMPSRPMTDLIEPSLCKDESSNSVPWESTTTGQGRGHKLEKRISNDYAWLWGRMR